MFIIVVSVGGASDREIHDVVQSESQGYGYPLTRSSYLETNAPTIAIAGPESAEEFRNAVIRHATKGGSRNKAKLSLLLVGKSAGAIQIWNSLRLHWNNFNDFHRIAAVLIDPHGAVYGDSRTGPYCDRQDLWWPHDWPSNTDFFRVYHIYQQQQWGSPDSSTYINLTGADFPDGRVYRSIKLSGPDVNHTNIPMHPESRRIIRDALGFACLPRGETVAKPLEIKLRNVKGRNTVDGKQDIIFYLNNLKCDCYDADVQVVKDGVQLTTLRDIYENEFVRYRPPTRGRKMILKAICGTRRAETEFFLDYEPPTFHGIEITPNTRVENSMVVAAVQFSDDGYWNVSDYHVEVTLDRTVRYAGSGTSITLNNLSEGQHSATMRIKDGFGRWSDSKTKRFNVSTDRATLAFVEPGENTLISYKSTLDIVVEASHIGGIMRVSIYLDRISDDEFDFTRICTIPGTFGIGQSERRRCSRVSVISSGSVNWSPGNHKLIAVAVDNSGNETTVERTVRVGKAALTLGLLVKRRVFFGVVDAGIAELIRTGSENDFEEIGHQVGLDADHIRETLSDPQMLKGLRLNPNRLRREQLELIPSLTPTDITTILMGKPYYSLDELKVASNLSPLAIRELFEIEPYSFLDPITRREVSLHPVFGRYILPASEFEADPALASGYAEVYSPSARVSLRVVQAVDFEAEQRPHLLKHEFKGQVYPVMRDIDGVERYLVPGFVDVWFKRQVSDATRETILEELHLEVTDAVPEVGYFRTRLTVVPENDDVIHAVLKVIDEALKRSEVSFAEPDQLGFEDFDPDLGHGHGEDEFEAMQRYWNEIAIDLARAHAITKGSEDVTVLVIDSGCRMDHEALSPAYRSDWASLDLSFDLGEAPEVTSPNEIAVSHGTKVAGVIRQIAPECSILPVKIPGNAGGAAAPGYGLRAAAIFKALDYVPAGKHAVMNLSWKTNGEHIGIREALRSAQDLGLVLVASAGNYVPGATRGPNDIHYPSAHSYRNPVNRALLSVAALGPNDVLASYSYYGSDSVTVSAPGGEPGGMGSEIYSATTATPTSHTYVAGTSFSAPHVAGLAALLFSAKPELTAEQVITCIKGTADKINAPNAGAGRINAGAALEQVAGPATTHMITATAGSHGAVVPAGEVIVPEGGSRRFEFVPNPGYVIEDILLDGLSIGSPGSYTFTDVFTDHILDVTFTEPSEPEGFVNINSATAAELEILPYIGLWLADQIVSYRQANGPYSSIWDLSAVGMSNWAIKQIASRITV